MEFNIKTDQEPDRFTFHRSFYDAALELKDANDRLCFYDALCEYAFTGSVGIFEEDMRYQPLLIALKLAIPEVKRSITSCSNGRRGGRPRNS